MTNQQPSVYEQLCKQLGYHFHDDNLVSLALTHRSYSASHNERLEFLGDSILNYLIAEALYKQFPNAREGDLSRMRAQLVKGETLAGLAREFALGQHLKLGIGEKKSGGNNRESILANTLEALVAAIYLDAGIAACRERVLSWYAKKLGTISPLVNHKDAKTQLQEWLQARKQTLPVYQLISTSGSDHRQTFKVGCKASLLNEVALGIGSSRRSAEQAAAAEALNQLKARLVKKTK